MIQDVRIELTGPGHGHVFINGEEVSGVRKISFASEVGCLNVVALEIVALNLSIAAPAEVTREVVELPKPRRTALQWARSLFRRRT